MEVVSCMRTLELSNGTYEVRSDAGLVLGWIDVEGIPDRETMTIAQKFVAKPIEGNVRTVDTIKEAAAHIAGSWN